MANVIFDSDYELCTIDVESFLEESLGKPLTLPEGLREALDADWATDSSEELCAYFQSLTEKEYYEADRNNVYNNENDFDSFFVYTIFAPVGERDWIWTEDCFVTVEIGGPGDPRYVAYSPALVYRVPGTLGDSGFFSWNIGWNASPISSKSFETSLDDLNERLSPGYSSYPTSELRGLAQSDPIWSEKRQGFLARLRNFKVPVLLSPYHY